MITLRRYSALLTALALAACTTSPRVSTAPVTTTNATAMRPRPYPIPETHAFARAVERGTRTRTGAPGPNYWQQYARYRIDAQIEPTTRVLTGREVAWYLNRSPDTLRAVFMHVNQNLFAPNALRNGDVPLTSGMALSRVDARGETLYPADTGAGYAVDATRLRIRPRAPVLPGDSLQVEIEWQFIIPPDGAPRSGVTGTPETGISMMVSYWYPQFAVYDDINDWQIDPYMGNAEFYMGYADYDVALTLPAGWLVGATGDLVNASEVLTPQTRQRLAEARRGNSVVHVVAEQDRGAGKATTTGRSGYLNWRYRANNVRDFSFGASDAFLWDATIAVVGDRNGDAKPDTTDIYALYRPFTTQWAWNNAATYARSSIEFLSRFLWPYPYPHMLALDGPVSCSGMEYPMMTCIGGPRDTLALYSVIVHEFGHMWFPMQVGSDERRYAWQDEGLTRYNQSIGMQEYFKGYNRERLFQQTYLSITRGDDERPLMTWGDLYPIGTAAYGVASYDKMASNIRALRAILGDETFLRAYREYGRRWVNKHPTPYDFWNTFSAVSGQNLDWFFRTWWFETWTLDQAIASVTPSGDALTVTIEDRGMAPMPTWLVVTRADGSTSRFTVPVDTWLAGARRATLTVPNAATVRKMEIDPEQYFVDVDRGNNVWSAGGRERGSGGG